MMQHRFLLGRFRFGACAAILLAGTGLFAFQGQFQFPGTKFSKGQDVSPTYEGWQSNADGTFTLYFGYYNRNAEEELDVPVGPNNNFDNVSTGDQGQPTHFYTGRRWFVFKVVVPKDWPVDKRVVWTLTTNGRTDQAKGWLEPEWEVDNPLITKNAVTDRTIGIWETEEIEGNQPPTVTGSGPQTVTLPGPATLSVNVTDDGIPKPKPGGRGRGGRPQGTQVRWIFYRGPAKPQFAPEVTNSPYGSPAKSETKVSFLVPGHYRIRALACDGALFTTYDYDVTVNPGSSAANGR